MSSKDFLENVKKLRELTGVGFKDCKLAIDETGGDLEKAVDFLRKKGIAKASKKMSRTASEGIVLPSISDPATCPISILSVERASVPYGSIFISLPNSIIFSHIKIP